MVKEKALRKGTNKQTNPKGNSSYVPHKGIAPEWRKRNGFCGYRNKWRNSTLFGFFFLCVCCQPATSVIHGNQGFSPVSVGKWVAYRIFPFSTFPISRAGIIIFLCPGLEGVRPEKTLDLLRVKTIFSLRSDLKKDQQLEHKAVYEFFFPSEGAMQ